MSEDIYCDSMTGLFNRRYLEEMVPGIVQDFLDHGQPFTLAMVDLDHFKTINDLHGHARGDAVLRAFGQFIRETTRSTDTVIRYGGDEIICFLPHLRRQNAEPLLERILQKCAEHDFDGIKVTLSIGLGSYPDDGSSYEKVFKAADASLYDAKRNGRNRIGTTQKKQISLPIKAFVNRRDELNTLLGAIGDDGGGIRIVVINGNVGVGKTRLSREGLGMLSGHEILWADCLLFNETIAYYAIRELIKYRLQRQGSADLDDLPLAYRAEIGKLIPEVMETLPAEAGAPVLDRYRLYEGIRRSIEAGGLPKVLIIDNFQWIDKESLDVIRYLVRTMQDSPHTLLLINRVEEIPEAISEFIYDASRQATLSEISLNPFTYPAVQECLRAIIGDEPEPKLVEYVFQTSGGNPYFLEELIRALAAGKFLSLEEEQWRFRLPQTEIIPKSIERIALRKYDLLSHEAQQVLHFASILGKFDISLLRRLTTYGESELHALLAQIDKYGLGKESRGQIVFVDEFSRRAIYQKLAAHSAIHELHRQIAELLEADHRGKEAEIADELAYHFYQAGTKDKGLKYCLLAGRLATEKYANESALRYYSWAEKMLEDEKDNEAQRFDVLQARERVYDLQGARTLQQKDLAIMEQLAQSLGDRRRQAEVAFGQASYSDATGDYATAIAMAQRAIELATTAQAFDMEANGHVRMGTILWQKSRFAEAQTHLERGLLLARDHHLPVIETHCLSNLGVVSALQARFVEAERYFHEALQLSRQTGDRRMEGILLNNLGNTAGECKDWLKARDYFEQGLQVARKIGNRRAESLLVGNLGLLFSELGDYENAKTYLEQALVISRSMGDRRNECLKIAGLGLLFHHLGENEAARECCQKALAIGREIGDRDAQGYGLICMGDILADLGHWAEAIEAYQHGLDVLHEIGRHNLAVEPLAGLARICLAQNNHDQARAYVDEILDLREKYTLNGTKEPMLIYLTCMRVLRASQDARAEDLLETAYHQLQEQAAKINEAKLRQLFLQNVPAHREIIAEFQREH